MSYPPNSSRPGTMPVSATVATHESPETPDPVVSPDVPDVKADNVAASVAGSIASAESWYHSHQADTYGQGSTIGTLLDLPPVPAASSKHTGPPDGFADDPAG